ncbi:MAG TPA: hypothetical protein VIL37_16605 [Natronosporangium sp.]
MTYGSDIHGWPSDDLDVPPHSIDLDTVVQIGRQQVRRRRVAMVGGAVTMLAAVAVIPAATQLWPPGGGDQRAPPLQAAGTPLPVLDCDVTALPLPPEYAEHSVIVAAMDPTGRYVVGTAHPQTTGAARGHQVAVTSISDDTSAIAGEVYYESRVAPDAQLVTPMLWHC